MSPPPQAPSLRVERRLLRDGAPAVVGVDEVGRGSLAGPVTVGAVMLLPQTRSAPPGVRDSKELTPQSRARLAPRLQQWAAAWSLGHASPEEIDVHGIIAALRLAAVRALRQLPAPSGALLLDGSHDWLGDATGAVPEIPGSGPVVTRVKADRDCSSVAAASVLAKVGRDRLMVALAARYDGYGWEQNKGYSATEHLRGLASLGATPAHRLSWQLPGVGLSALDRLDPLRRRTWRRFASGEQLVLLPQGDPEPR